MGLGHVPGRGRTLTKQFLNVKNYFLNHFKRFFTLASDNIIKKLFLLILS
jgi:hypothetical protein